MTPKILTMTAADAARSGDNESNATTEFDQQRIERAVREMLLAIGEDPDREGLADTPSRVARSWRELFGGLLDDPARHLERTFEAEGDGLVTLADIEFKSMCEHHLLPVHGKAHVAYQPDGERVVGLSKLARTVEVFARRPQLQERMTAQIADALMEHLDPAGVLVVVEAEHSCMTLRGVNKQGSMMRTMAQRGTLADDRDARDMALRLLGLA